MDLPPIPLDDPTPPNPAQNTPASAASPQRMIVEHTSGGGFARLMSWISWTGFAIFLGLFLFMVGVQKVAHEEYYDTNHGIEEKYHSGKKEDAADKIAVIQVKGVILEGDGYVKQQIDRIRDDKNVKAIVLRVDSPGGTVTGSDYIYHHLKKLRAERKDLPLVVSMGGFAASGGYYISMAVGDQKDSIFAEPTTTTGSIGVIIPHYDITGLMEEYGIVDDSIKSHPRKQMLSMTHSMSDDQRELVQGYVNDSFTRFKEIIAEGRPVFKKDPEALTELATGEIFNADKAKEHGLVDKIGFIEDAIERAADLANLKADQYRVVKYKRPKTLMGQFTGSAHAGSTGFDLTTLLDLSVPRAYYLSTSLPTLVTSQRAD